MTWEDLKLCQQILAKLRRTIISNHFLVWGCREKVRSLKKMKRLSLLSCEDTGEERILKKSLQVSYNVIFHPQAWRNPTERSSQWNNQTKLKIHSLMSHLQAGCFAVCSPSRQTALSSVQPVRWFSFISGSPDKGRFIRECGVSRKWTQVQRFMASTKQQRSPKWSPTCLKNTPDKPPSAQRGSPSWENGFCGYHPEMQPPNIFRQALQPSQNNPAQVLLPRFVYIKRIFGYRSFMEDI